MVEPHQTATDVTPNNELALRSLARAIRLSAGQFSIVLARCNYTVLRSQMMQRLPELLQDEYSQIYQFVVPENAVSLYTTIQLQLGHEQPAALIVFGLESVESLDDLLSTTNQIRDEFRKQLPLPMVLWVNDEILHKLVRLAPDFASWAATPIKFEMGTQELLQFLQQQTDSLFAKVLDTTAVPSSGRISTLGQVQERSYELYYAIRELQGRGITVAAELDASLEFVFGLDDYVSDAIDSALKHFLASLQYWQQLSATPKPLHHLHQQVGSQIEIIPSYTSSLLKQGVLLFYIGQCYCRRAESHEAENRRYWLEAKSYFQQCVHILEEAQRQDIIPQFIIQLGEVLQNLRSWQELQAVAHKSLALHAYATPMQLACGYGFLAEAAVQRLRWEEAGKYARIALLILAGAKTNIEPYQGLFPLLLEQLYHLLLVKALRNLGQPQLATEHLETASQELYQALETSDHRYDAHRYIRNLRKLRSLYFEAGRYLEAFRIKHKRRSVEQQYGLRAFIGAGRLRPQLQAINPAFVPVAGGDNVALEIAASGRQQDIERLFGRISRADQKLTIIHGQSGVGKSSTVNAGLVPALQHRAIGDQIAVPVVLQVYTDWVRQLSKSLAEAIARLPGAAGLAATPINSISTIVHKLQELAQRNIITVLIFDQFEEFLFGSKDAATQEEFDKFISDCLQIAFVKVILSLREDYLIRLLEFKHLAALKAVDNNILDKKIRYQLNNFSQQDAKAVIHSLTERSQLHLEPDLINALVDDLAATSGEVRPIELQVVGAQLQDERITQLVQYQPFRPNKLIERYIKELIRDCGPENERAALIVLYLLTDEDHKRPFKTRAELDAELSELEDAGKLELVLEILVRSGLVVLFPDVPDRYQLIHDYLVDLIRFLQHQESGLQAQLVELQSKVEQIQAEAERLRTENRHKQQPEELIDQQPQSGSDLLRELRSLRKREEQSRTEIERLRAELKEKELLEELAATQEKQRLSEAKLNRVLKTGLAGSVVVILLFFLFIIRAVNSEIRAETASSEALFANQPDINALKEGIKAARKQQRAIWVDAETQEKVRTALYQAVYGVRERNRLEKHQAAVYSVIFSPDGQLIASASADNTIKIWSQRGKWLATLSGHKDVVNSISFSPDGQRLVSGSQDNTIKLWSREGKLLSTFKAQSPDTQGVNSVSFSPNGQIIASASNDQTVKLWSRDGKLLKSLKVPGTGNVVLGLTWSADSKIIAGGSADGTIILWNLEGKVLKILPAHSDAVLGIAWSPDGKTIASASADNTIKLWSHDGKWLRTLPGHNDKVTGVAFTPDSQTLASASIDFTIKLWHRQQGTLIRTLKGHNNWVNSVSFSPDGKTLASASRDKSIKLWAWNYVSLRTLSGHTDAVTSVSVAPQGDLIASASEDKTIKLWNTQDKLQKTLLGHTGKVWGVAWSPDGQLIASASSDKTVKLWSRNGRLIANWVAHSDEVLSVAWSRQGKMLASASKDKTVKLWSPEGKLLHTLSGHSGAVNWVSFSPDGQLIASASDDTTVKIWRADGTLWRTLGGHKRPVYGVAWSPDGQAIASASIDSTVRLWGWDGNLIKSLDGSGDWFTSVSFSPDGRILVATSDDKLRLWRADGTFLAALKGHQDSFTSVSFSPDSQMLMSGNVGGRVLVWDLEDLTLDNLLRRGCNWLHDYLDTKPYLDEGNHTLCPYR